MDLINLALVQKAVRDAHVDHIGPQGPKGDKGDKGDPLTWDDLTEEQIREYALLDNKTNELADWDFELLGEELADLDLSDFDLDWVINEDDNSNKERIDKSDKLNDIYEITISCQNENDLENIYNEFIERGYKCKISTL